MKFFVDTADTAEIADLAATGMVDGVTTNPSLIKKSGRDIMEVTREICGLTDGPVSAEVVALDHETMMKEAEVLRKIADNIAIRYFLTFSKMPRPSSTAATIDAKLSSKSVIAEASLLTSVDANQPAIEFVRRRPLTGRLGQLVERQSKLVPYRLVGGGSLGGAAFGQRRHNLQYSAACKFGVLAFVQVASCEMLICTDFVGYAPCGRSIPPAAVLMRAPVKNRLGGQPARQNVLAMRLSNYVSPYTHRLLAAIGGHQSGGLPLDRRGRVQGL